VIDIDYTKLPGGGLQPPQLWSLCNTPTQELPTKITFPMICYYEKGSGGVYLNSRWFTSGATGPCYPNYNTFNPGGNSGLAGNFHTQCFNLEFKAGDFDNTQFFDLQIPIEGGVWYTFRGHWVTTQPTNIFKIKQCNPLIIEGNLQNLLEVPSYYPGGNYSERITPCSVQNLIEGTGSRLINIPIKMTIKEWDSNCVEGREYKGTVAHWYCTPAGCVQSDGPPQDKTAGPFNSKADCNEGCGTATSSKWWCVNGACVKSATQPAGATAGPFNTLAECEGGCAPPTPNPFWCVGGSCVQSATQPAGATAGPFQTIESCIAGCAPPTQNKWWCIYGMLVQGVSSPHPDATGPFNSTTEANCGPAQMVWHCGETGPAKISRWEAVQRGFQYWPTEQEVIDAGCVLKWYCAPEGCGSFTSPPVGSTGGPYNSEAECQIFCQAGAVKFWCVANPNGGLNQCVQSINPPSGTVSGPYTTSVQCFENCNLVIADALPVTRSPSISSAQVQRVTIPCIHLGDNIEDPATCGCGTAVLRSCAVHGQCRKTGYPKAGESICLTCPDYQAPAS
jgi:hypothetical protein